MSCIYLAKLTLEILVDDKPPSCVEYCERLGLAILTHLDSNVKTILIGN